jgi:predicted esterase
MVFGMRTVIYVFLTILLTASFVSAQNNQPEPKNIVKVEADAAKGFSYPYYLYIPDALRDEKAKLQTHNLLVVPNNTGTGSDDFAVHEKNVKQKMMQVGMAFGKLNVPVLMPVFPRPGTDWKIYTHALDRDSLLTEKAEYRRFDLQLAAMIRHARERFAKENVKIDERVLMYGFSASGMFVNRFAFLHPDMVKAVAGGSPGGWAIAPTEKSNGKTLRYPIGTGDFKLVAGRKLDSKKLQKVAFFIFMGDKDENDSVTFGDGYEEEDKNLVFELFGKTPLERWEISRKLYEENKLQAEFKLYPGVAHKVTPEMIGDIQTFFGKFANK